MASSPDSEPDGPPSSSNSTLPPVKSPPDRDSSSAPPPSNDSPPPRSDSPPPESSAPPPPPPPPPSPPPKSKSPPPPSKSPSSPPPPKSPSPPPPTKSSPPPSPPNSPPPASPPPPAPPSPDSSPPIESPPAASPPPPTSTSSPSYPLGSSSSPPSAAFSPPPPINSLSPPETPASTPPRPSSDTSPPSGSAPRPPSKSGSSSSSVSGKHHRILPPHNAQSIKISTAVGVVAGVLILGLVLALFLLRRRRRRHTHYDSVYMLPFPYSTSPASGTTSTKPKDGGGGDYVDVSPDNVGIGNSKTWFSYEELSAASGGFATQNILGRGGFGSVYKGCLQDGREVAIKKLKDNSGQGDREFKAEVEIIRRVHHRHLVSLVGYCIEDTQKLLVYEFVPNDTLHYHLHNSSRPAMQWNLRVKVACGSARGIAYLHEDCHPRIIHRDIKSANILIDNNFEAKVADFGLAKLAQELESNTHVSTRVMGTFGYMAPEYATSGKLTEKSDIFSFGVVLLEIITGRKPVDENRPLGDESLVEWARSLMTEALDNQNFDKLADPRLQGNYDKGEMFRMIEVAAACVRHSAVKRPKMSQVVRALDTMNELSDISNGMRPGQSGIYDSREQSAEIRLFQRMAFESQELSIEQDQGMS